MFSGSPQLFNKPILTRLPTELHFEIVNHLRINASWSALCALSLVCSLFRDIAQKALYSSIEISHQMRQLEKIHSEYDGDYRSEPGLDEASARAATSSPTLAHPLRTIASGATEHPDLLRHVRTLIIDCSCYLGCEHHVLVIQIANLFLDHLVDMTSLRDLELRATLIIKPDIYGGIIALASRGLQEITLDLVHPPVVPLQSLTDHDSELFSCTRLDIVMGAEDLSGFYVWVLNRCQRLTVLSLRGDIFEILNSITGLTFRNLERLDIECDSTTIAEPLSSFLQSNPSVANLRLRVPDIIESDIALSEGSLPVLRSIEAPILVMCKFLRGRPIVNIRSDIRNTVPKIGLVPQLIDAVGLSGAKEIDEFAVGVSPREDLDRTLEKVLECMKNVKHLKLHDLPDDDAV